MDKNLMMLLHDKIAVLNREVECNMESIGALRLALNAMRERIETLEDRCATLEAAQRVSVSGGIQGLDGTITVTFPPEWGETVPLVEIASDG